MLTFEEFCADDGEFAGERGSAFAAIFPQVSRILTLCLLARCGQAADEAAADVTALDVAVH